jgi:CubicO group peptidase (beta-lactamase class C family)
MSTETQGRCHPKFTRVRDAFAKEFADGNELGASLCLTLEGETVVDLWAGFMDGERTQPWQRDTLANVYSTTKGITALAAHRLVDEGLLDLDAPVARYWPEFAQNGKERLPVRFLLSHQAGLCAISQPISPETIYDWSEMTRLLAEQKPWWEPGTAHGYHALTFGWLVGELVRRLRGKKIGDVVREEIATPLGVEFEIGFGPELDARVAPLLQGPLHPPPGEASLDMLATIQQNPDGMLARTFGNPALLTVSPNTRVWRAAELAAANGHSNAHSLARIYGALANGGALDGVRLLSKEAVERASAEQVNGKDEVLPVPATRLGLGFFLPTDAEPLGPNPRAFGHGGAGGSYSMADPESRLSFGYVMNLMHTGLWLVDPRPRRLLAAAYASL